MNGIGTRQLETSRLILRRFETRDANDMYHNYTSDDEVTKYLTWPTHKSKETTRDYVESMQEQYSNPFFFNWAIQDKALGQVIGSIAVVRYDEKTESVHIGYVLGRAWWGKGIMTEALTEVIRFCMDEVGVKRVESRHDPRNGGSGGVMVKSGMEYEGCIRGSDWNNQGICDAAWYGLMREDYYNKTAVATDCGFTHGNHWFRYRAAAIIIEDGAVLFAKNKRDNFYYSIGGGVHMGETSTEAIRREVYEETGAEYEIDRLAFIHENYFTGTVSLSGYECHEIALYYLMKPRGSRQLNSNSYTGGVKEEMHWLPIEAIEMYEAYPSFYKERLKEIIESDHVVHIVTDERMKVRE